MKRGLWIVFLIMALTTLSVACGGGAEPAAVAPAAESQTDTSSAEPASQPTEAPAVEEPAVAEEPAAAEEEAAPAADEAAASGDTEASSEDAAAAPASGDWLTSGIDPETGLEINPPDVVPGVDFIVRGEINNFNLIPAETPEFVVISPEGVRYRIQTQHVDQIFFEDGSQPAKHEFRRGLRAEATVRQEPGAGATIIVDSTDFTLFHPEQ